jgi:hypothetical protein
MGAVARFTHVSGSIASRARAKGVRHVRKKSAYLKGQSRLTRPSVESLTEGSFVTAVAS